MNANFRDANNCEFLKHVLERLQQHGFASLNFGGWAEELLQLVPPRPHRDVDLLPQADSFVAFDRFLASAESHGWREIAAKRFAHKRAILAQGVMVEFTLVESGLITNFWGDVAFHWLDPLAHARPIEIVGFPLRSFRRRTWCGTGNCTVRPSHGVGGSSQRHRVRVLPDF